jgi:hypothetical protein
MNEELNACGASAWPYLRWEGQAQKSKTRGILGTLGTLELFLGEYARFSRVPKVANGTLETKQCKSLNRRAAKEPAHT